jgi:hypothetical protein
MLQTLSQCFTAVEALVVKGVKDYGNSNFLVYRQTILQAEGSVVVLDNQPAFERLAQRAVSLNKPIDGGALVTIHPTYMNLDLGTAVQGHFVENGTMILKFPYTALHHIVFLRVDDYKLIRMHGNSNVMLFYELADFSKLPPEMTCPVKGANGV